MAVTNGVHSGTAGKTAAAAAAAAANRMTVSQLMLSAP